MYYHYNCTETTVRVGGKVGDVCITMSTVQTSVCGDGKVGDVSFR